MFFSIVIPMYNVQEYIGKCIESLLSQDMNDFEIVVIDDGSTDSSNKIVSEIALRNPCVRLITKPNGGQSTARNRGLAEAKGKYIIYLDSDDFISENSFLSDVYAQISKTDADVCMYRYRKYFENRSNPFLPCHYSFDSVKGVTDFSEMIYRLAQADAYYGSAWSKAVRRDILVDNNIKFDESLKCEDIDWNYRLMENTRKLTYVDGIYVAYRQREGSVTRTADLKSVNDFLKTLEFYKARYEDENTPLSAELKKAFLCTLAKYYSNLLINYCELDKKHRKVLKNRVKNIAGLLDYAVSSRPCMVRKFYRVFGFSLTVLAMSILDKIKR